MRGARNSPPASAWDPSPAGPQRTRAALECRVGARRPGYARHPPHRAPGRPRRVHSPHPSLAASATRGLRRTPACEAGPQGSEAEDVGARPARGRTWPVAPPWAKGHPDFLALRTAHAPMRASGNPPEDGRGTEGTAPAPPSGRERKSAVGVACGGRGLWWAGRAVLARMLYKLVNQKKKKFKIFADPSTAGGCVSQV